MSWRPGEKQVGLLSLTTRGRWRLRTEGIHAEPRVRMRMSFSAAEICCPVARTLSLCAALFPMGIAIPLHSQRVALAHTSCAWPLPGVRVCKSSLTPDEAPRTPAKDTPPHSTRSRSLSQQRMSTTDSESNVIHASKFCHLCHTCSSGLPQTGRQKAGFGKQTGGCDSRRARKTKA